MPDLSVDDFKNVLFDLYLAQRENAVLRAVLAQSETDDGVSIPPEEEVS